MKTLMVIETAHNGMYFSLTYLAALIIGAGIVIYTGFRKGYPKLTWLIILLTGGLFFIIGEKVFSYSGEQWSQVFTSFNFAPTDKKTILGGIIGLFAGLLLAKSLLSFKQPVLDNFAIALPVAMAISRIGCLMAGCCYGTPTDLPWGISYDMHSMAYHTHLSHGLIDPNSFNSLAIHPVQLYQVFGCLLIASIVWMTRKKWKANGSLFIFSVLSYAMLRFLVEFVRDPASSFVLIEQYYGMKAIQWVLVAILITGAFILIFREIINNGTHHTLTVIKVKDIQLGLLTGFLWFITLIGKNWFTDLELLTICIFLTPVTIGVVIHIYCNKTAPVFRWVFPLIFMGCFMFMSQTTIPTEKEKNKNKVTFTELGLDGIYGKYSEDVRRVCYSGSSCSGKYYESIGSQDLSFYRFGIDVSHNMWRDDNFKFKIGAKGFYGRDSEGEFNIDYPDELTIGISPHVNFDWRYFGFGTGFSVGQMKFGRRNVDIDEFSVGTVKSADYDCWYFIPALSLRFGPYDILYLEGNVPGLFPSSAPYPLYQIGLGTGLGKTNGTKAAIGYCYDGFYSELTYPFKNNLVLKAFYANSLKSGDEAKSALSVGLNFRFYSQKNQSTK